LGLGDDHLGDGTTAVEGEEGVGDGARGGSDVDSEAVVALFYAALLVGVKTDGVVLEALVVVVEGDAVLLALGMIVVAEDEGPGGTEVVHEVDGGVIDAFGVVVDEVAGVEDESGVLLIDKGSDEFLGLGVGQEVGGFWRAEVGIGDLEDAQAVGVLGDEFVAVVGEAREFGGGAGRGGF